MAKAGFGAADITPAAGAELAGYHSKRLADGMLDPLYVQAFVLDAPTARLALLVFDLMAVEADQTEAIRAHLLDSLGIPGDSIIVTCTHTHTAPVVFKFFESDPVPG